MTKNVARPEQIVRIVLGLLGGLLALLVSGWPAAVRIAFGATGLFLIATAAVGY